MKKYIIERIENNIAIIEDENGKTFEIKKKLIKGCKENDVIYKNNNVFVKDEKETCLRKQLILKKQNNLFKNSLENQ